MEALSVQTGNRWRDFSTDPFRGDVLTLTVDSGRLVLAALSVFITLVSGSTWAIISFGLHQLRARDQATADGLYLQSQVLLRHPTTPLTAIKEIVFVWWAWQPIKAPKRVTHLVRRLLPILLLASLTFAAFTVAAIYVTKVARLAYTSSDVLLNPVNCGVWSFNMSTQAGKAAARDKNANDTRNARAYAQNCYEQHSETGICSLYPKVRIDVEPSDVPCPFGADPAGEATCLYGENQAVRLDTGLLNSNDVFGINTGPANQILVRKVVTCSPFHATNYVEQSLSPQGGYTVWNFDLGYVTGAVLNYTYSYNTYGRSASLGYYLHSVSTVGEFWRPVQALRTIAMDADVSAHFLSQNSVMYEVQVEDIWFSATRTEGQAEGYYGPNQYTNVLVCAEQHQLVNPVIGTQSELSKVGDLGKTYRDLGFNAYQEAIATRFILAFALSSMFNTITNLGASSLLASDRMVELVGTTLPDNQWQREVRGWFETALARIQWFIIEYNSNTVALGEHGSIIPPDSTSRHPVDMAQLDLCSLQRVRNTGDYQTFSFAGIMITVCIGGILLVISWGLEWTVQLCRRYYGKHPHRETARVSDGKYQLLRKNLCATTGSTSTYNGDVKNAWDNVLDEIPVAKPDVQFWLPKNKAQDYRYDPASDSDLEFEEEQRERSHEMRPLPGSTETQYEERARQVGGKPAATSEVRLLGDLHAG